MSHEQNVYLNSFSKCQTSLNLDINVTLNCQFGSWVYSPNKKSKNLSESVTAISANRLSSRLNARKLAAAFEHESPDKCDPIIEMPWLFPHSRQIPPNNRPRSLSSSVTASTCPSNCHVFFIYYFKLRQMNCEETANLTFTSINESYTKWTGHCSVVSQISLTVFFRGEACHGSTSRRAGVLCSERLSPALALGQYADRYRKAHESHLMSVCRLCLAVLQRLRVVCHDNEIHNAWWEGRNKEATSVPLREMKKLEGEREDDGEGRNSNLILIVSCATWGMPTRIDLFLAICGDHKIKTDMKLNYRTRHLPSNCSHLIIFTSRIKRRANKCKTSLHNWASCASKMNKYDFILLGRQPPNHSVLKRPHLTPGLRILWFVCRMRDCMLYIRQMLIYTEPKCYILFSLLLRKVKDRRRIRFSFLWYPI